MCEVTKLEKKIAKLTAKINPYKINANTFILEHLKKELIELKYTNLERLYYYYVNSDNLHRLIKHV